MNEPTPDSLRALAGWTISKQSLASPSQAVALHKLRDGCEMLSEDFPATMTVPVRQPITETRHETEVSPSQVSVIPPEVLAAIGQNVVKDPSGCVHKFHIGTQRCIYCGVSYLQAHGRKPELMQ